jgi:hypothetical protein
MALRSNSRRLIMVSLSMAEHTLAGSAVRAEIAHAACATRTASAEPATR